MVSYKVRLLVVSPEPNHPLQSEILGTLGQSMENAVELRFLPGESIWISLMENK